MYNILGGVANVSTIFQTFTFLKIILQTQMKPYTISEGIMNLKGENIGDRFLF
jgi:hypothetical protein